MTFRVLSKLLVSFISQVASFEVIDNSMYFTFEEFMAIIDYLFESQLLKFYPNIKIKLIINYLLIILFV